MIPLKFIDAHELILLNNEEKITSDWEGIIGIKSNRDRKAIKAIQVSEITEEQAGRLLGKKEHTKEGELFHVQVLWNLISRTLKENGHELRVGERPRPFTAYFKKDQAMARKRNKERLRYDKAYSLDKILIRKKS